jgi:sec-independent protein translocase protein TatA
MGGFSLIHWIILAVLLLLLFGGSRFSNMMGDVAKGLKSFKQGLADEDEPNKAYPPNRQVPPPQSIDVQSRPVPTQTPVADPVVPPPPIASPDEPQR